MSADLVGSTAFKADKRHADPRNGSPSPGWVDEFRTFYKDFPLEVGRSYRHALGGITDESLLNLESFGPKVWKTIGDEIIFCNRVKSVEHAAVCVSAFLKAIETYSRKLEPDSKLSLVNSLPCDAAGEKLDRGDEQPRGC